MKTRAAVLRQRGEPLTIETIDLDPPGPGELLVEVRAAGVCHSDLHPARDDWPTRTPLVLGHEGSGVVREVGAGVAGVAAGDAVVFCWAPPCGTCPACVEGQSIFCDRLDRTTYRNRLPSGGTRMHADGEDLGQFLGTGCFAAHTVVAAEGAVPVGAAEDDGRAGGISFEALATVGCAVVTGVGAVLTAARVPPGARIAVIGAGGVGLNVLQGAALAGCDRMIAVDTHQAPLAMARRLGASDLVDATGDDAAAGVRQLTGGRGADFVFDTVGTPATLAVALEAARKGGTVVVTGLSRLDALGQVPLFPFVMQGKRLIGSVYGSGSPRDDIRRIIEYHRQGRIRLAELISRKYALTAVNQAFEDLSASQGGRGLVCP
jgi:S-(hydroxymethyl)glutathione dehydrogenase/alcohol dehydrogenase